MDALPLQLALVFGAPALAVAGAAAVAIPVAIHLLSRVRRTRVDWGAMRFVRLAYQRQRRRLRFERWLLLVTRCVLVVLAGLALAGPVLTGAVARWGSDAAGGDGGPLHLVVDNGLSSQALIAGAQGTRFEATARTAGGLAAAAVKAGRAVRVWPATPGPAGQPAQVLDHDALAKLAPTHRRADLAGTLARVARARAADAAEGRGTGVVAVVSDWSSGAVSGWGADQAGGGADAAGALDPVAGTLWISLPESGVANTQVAQLQLTRSWVLHAAADKAQGGLPAVVRARVTLRRFGAVLDEGRSTLALTLAPWGASASASVGGSVQAEQEVMWSAGQASATLSVELAVPKGARGVYALTARRVGEADALAADDARHALVLVRQGLSVALVDGAAAARGAGNDVATGAGLGGADFVRAALAPDGLDRGEVTVTDVPPGALDRAGAWRDGDAVVVLAPDRLTAQAWEGLESFAQGGGVVWCCAPGLSAGGPEQPAWFGAFTRRLAPGWSLAQAATPRDANAAPRRLDAQAPAPDPLALLLADWPALLAPVRLGGSLPLRVTDAKEAWLSTDADTDTQADVVLAVARVGAGAAVLLAVPPDPALGSNLAAKPLFPALLHDALRALRGAPGLSDGLIGQPRTDDDPVVLEQVGVADDEAPQGREQADAPGFYRPLSGPGRAVALNVVAQAGDLREVSATALVEQLKPWGEVQFLDAADPGAALRRDAARWPVGPLLLWVLVAVVLFETWVARRFSHAGVPRVAPGASRVAQVGAAGLALAGGLPAVGQAAGDVTPQAAGWLDRALGLDALSVHDLAAGLGWAHPLPAWAWLFIAASAGVLAWLAYRRMTGSRAARLGLAACRALLLLLLAALLAGPQWVRSDEIVEPDLLAVLVDRSASLGLTDLPPALGQTHPRSREAALADALLDQADLFGPAGLGRGREVAWWGFGAATAALPGGDPAAWPAAGEPASRLGAGIDAVLRAHPGRALAGVVVFTDGQSTDATGAELLARINRRGTAVYAVALGAQVPPRDLAVVRVEPPDVGFVNDAVPVRFRVTASGGAADQPANPADYRVQLVDTATDHVLDEQALESFDTPVRLVGRGAEPGPRAWAVQLVSNAPETRDTDELNRANNRAAFTVELIDRPLRVLYVEGRPRWEYRYLKNMLLREASIDVSVLLLSADDAFAQEGNTPITRLPESAEEWQAYDVVVLGDLPPAALGDAAVAQLRERVNSGGAGLLWVGGAGATPAAWGASGLEDLLPMLRPQAVGPVPAARFAIAPTPLAEALSVLRLSEDDGDIAAPAAVGGRSALRYAQDMGPLKPTAEVLARALPLGDAGSDLEPPPLVVQMRYGAGRSLYVATDETWRLRLGRGEALFERFWVQLVRLLGRPAAGRGEQGVGFDASARRLPVGGTLVLTLTSRDAGLNARGLAGVGVQVRAVGTDSPLGEVNLRPGPGGGPAAWEGRWRAEASGPDAVEFVVTEPALADLNLSVRVDVDRRDDERRVVAADRARLAALAQGTGGAVIELDQLHTLAQPGRIPNLSRTRVNDVREPLTRAPLVLGLILLLVTVEWIGRRLIRLA